jgi:hypothetical protein
VLLDEPKGWRKLQAMAQRERDPQNLASIIDQMNRLLDQRERTVATENAEEPGSLSRTSAGSVSLEVLPCQVGA